MNMKKALQSKNTIPVSRDSTKKAVSVPPGTIKQANGFSTVQTSL